MKKILFLCLLFLMHPVFATKYTIVLEAGDKNSTVYLYQYEPTETIPFVKSIFEKSNTESLSTFAEHPEKAGESLKTILDEVSKKLINLAIKPQQVVIQVLGTENMRLLSEPIQSEIYANVSQYIFNHYSFNLGQVKTLSRKLQGIYEWLDINYLAENFKNKIDPKDVLKIDNNLTSLTIANTHSVESHEEVIININKQTYYVINHSLSKLGENNLFLEMKKDIGSKSCFPIDFPLNQELGNFNFKNCAPIYLKLIKSYFQFPLLKSRSFIVYGDAYFIYDFLAAEIPDQLSFEARMYYVCMTPWSLMIKEYESMSEKELSQICANSVMVDRLIYEVLGLDGSQLWITNQINSKKINWSLGMVLLINTNISQDIGF